ncbi:MAG: protoheme IX farnesyltransferase [Desulforhopalus sp.]|jgi:protoheme IX farnesyltransferase
MIKSISAYARLGKTPLVLMVASSTSFGYLLYHPELTNQLLLSFLGVFFLAWGAASFNSVQEKEADSLYQRTRNRPVATGEISKETASIFAFVSCILGLSLLYFCGNNYLPMALGVAALIIYNLIYTPLKPISEFALIPGGISGALPPYIGWLSAGGETSSPLIWAIMALFFLWQPPHFCLILLEYAEDYRKKGKFQNLITRFSVVRVKKIIAVWLLAFLSIVLLLTILPSFLPQSVRLTLAAGGPLFVAGFLFHLFMVKKPRYKMLFISLNSFLFSIMALLTFSSILDTL